MNSLAARDVLHVFACAGYGTRLGQSGFPKAIVPLDINRDITTLEYHMRVLPLSSQIGIIAGKEKQQISNYLKTHDFFGHEESSIIWIPSLYQKPINNQNIDVPLFPYGSGSWLVFEQDLVNQLIRNGITYIIQAGGNKIGQNPRILEKMLNRIRETSAEWIVAIYNDVKEKIKNIPDWKKRFDLLCDGKGIPKGNAVKVGDIIVDWHVFKLSAIPRLWNPNVIKSIEQNAILFAQKRKYDFSGSELELYISEINMPLLLEYFRIETFDVSREKKELGFGLKTDLDIAKCNKLFLKREQCGVMRSR